MLNNTLGKQSGRRQSQNVGNYREQVTWFPQQMKVVVGGEGEKKRTITNVKGL